VPQLQAPAAGKKSDHRPVGFGGALAVLPEGGKRINEEIADRGNPIDVRSAPLSRYLIWRAGAEDANEPVR